MMARKSEGLGERSKKILEFLVSYQEKHGYPPSIREIGNHIHVESTSLVDYYLNQLQEAGYIERGGRISRSIRVLRTLDGQTPFKQALESAKNTVDRITHELISIPLIGRIGASYPIPMPESDVSYFDSMSTVEVAQSLLPSKEKFTELFALEVEGESMIDAMINDGDIVILKRAEVAQNGDMVAVWLTRDNETTLKYYYNERNGYVRLQPANRTMQPIIRPEKEVQVRGKVVLVLRQFKPH